MTLGRAHFPPVGLGLSSVILGAIGLLMFPAPVIGIPICCAGIGVGMAGIAMAAFSGIVRLRLCVAGVLLSASGAAIIGAIAVAPGGYFRPRAVFPTLPPAIHRPYVPPPAVPRSVWRPAFVWSASKT